MGANDGKLRAIKASTGKELWAVETGAEILAEPLVDGDKVFTANGLGVVSAYTKAGAKVWSFTAGDAVYSSPVMAEGKVVFGCNDGWLYALDAATGKPAWVNKDGTYTIESKPFFWSGKVYYGAWDQYIRCVNAKDGKLLWQRICEGSRVAKAAKRYYSPADAMPVVAEGKLMIADRKMTLTILNAETGEPAGSQRQVSATGISEDGKFVYLRKSNGNVAKIDSARQRGLERGRPRWGHTDCADREERRGLCVERQRHRLGHRRRLWEDPLAIPGIAQLFVMSSVACDGTNAYLTAFDGSLTAIKCAKR